MRTRAVRSRAIQCVLAVGVAAPASLVLAATQQPTMHVGANVQVSQAHSKDTHYEVVIAADPRDAKRLVIGSIIYPESLATYGTVVYSSSDAGQTWSPRLDGAALDHTGDPTVAFGPDGSAYYVASSIPTSGERRLMSFRSNDGGESWASPVSLTYMDREYVTVDNARGRVYVNGNNRVPRTVSDFVLFSSSDSGRTFQGPTTRAAFGTVQANVMGNAVVLSDASVVGVFAGTEKSGAARDRLEAIGWSPRDSSLVALASIDAYVAGGERKGALLGNANAEPALAVDETGGRFKDRLYVVWPDRRGGHAQIRFAFSADRGRTWSPSRVINDNPPTDTTDQFMPEVAVNRDGVIGVMWYDRRDHPDNLGWDVRFTTSSDGGTTFLPSVKVSARGATFPNGTTRARVPSTASGERAAIDAGRTSFTFMGGDTAGLAADATGAFHLAWVDNRTGVPQVWTATVTLR